MFWALCLLWCHEQDLPMIPGFTRGLEYVCGNSNIYVRVYYFCAAVIKCLVKTEKEREGLFRRMVSGEFCTIITGKAWQWEWCLGLLTFYMTGNRTETRSRHKLLSKLGFLLPR